MATPESDQPATIYQLKITLDNSDPPIWRRVQIEDCDLTTLHQVIQSAMGWDDDHMHEFEIGKKKYVGNPMKETCDEDTGDTTRLSEITQRKVKKIKYWYDFGDDWFHTIQIEKPFPAKPGVHYPRCSEGERACPPEDCGGIWGYYRLLDALSDPDHPEHEEMKEWHEDDIDPEAFDVEEVNLRWAKWDFSNIENYHDDEDGEDYDEDEDDEYLDDDDEDEDDDDDEDEPAPRPIVNESARVGRNDPCPCGSGKKYKKCCLGKKNDESIL
ncbi:MAG: SEC-C metal-binding domain-containing protein [Planctomycetia bacterium]|nr:SEC-C metal-binding domain-containing protein [Planctomycetia bacterium]